MFAAAVKTIFTISSTAVDRNSAPILKSQRIYSGRIINELSTASEMRVPQNWRKKPFALRINYSMRKISAEATAAANNATYASK